MAIKFKEAPQQSVHELTNAMTWFNEHKTPAVRSTALMASASGAQNIPHPVYNLDRDAIIAKKGLAAAKLVGWRYIIRDDANQYHVAEISVNETNNVHNFHSFNEGSHLDSFVSHFNNFSTNDDVNKKDYELNLLRVPSCYIMAIWLKDAAHNDLFIPLEPLQPGFVAGKTYNSADFMSIVEHIANDMAQQVDHNAK